MASEKQCSLCAPRVDAGVPPRPDYQCWHRCPLTSTSKTQYICACTCMSTGSIGAFSGSISASACSISLTIRTLMALVCDLNVNGHFIRSPSHTFGSFRHRVSMTEGLQYRVCTLCTHCRCTRCGSCRHAQRCQSLDQSVFLRRRRRELLLKFVHACQRQHCHEKEQEQSCHSISLASTSLTQVK